MAATQLALDLFDRRDPLACPHVVRAVPEVNRVVCGLGGREVYTNCHAQVAGEPPRCVHEPCDNSPEAVQRRLAWIAEREGGQTAQERGDAE